MVAGLLDNHPSSYSVKAESVQDGDVKASLLGLSRIYVQRVLISAESVEKSLVLAGLELIDEVMRGQWDLRQLLLYCLSFEAEPSQTSDVVLDSASGSEKSFSVSIDLLVGVKVDYHNCTLNFVNDIHNLGLMPVLVLVGDRDVSLNFVFTME